MRRILHLVLILGLFSCTQEALSPALDCLGEVTVDGNAICNTDDPEDKFCEIRYAGKFVLSDLSKSYLSMYCETIGSKILFTNGVGDDMEFTLIDKGYKEEVELVAQNIICGGPDETKKTLDCIEHEKAFIVLESPEHKIELSIVTLPDTQNSELGNVGDFFRIHREEVPGLYVQEWKSITDKRTLSYDMESCTQFYPTIELNGTIFQNVTGFVEQGDCAHYRYYVNQDYGLVGFGRAEEILWSLK